MPAGPSLSRLLRRALAAVLPRPQQSPPPHSQLLDFRRRRRRKSANQPAHGGFVVEVCGRPQVVKSWKRRRAQAGLWIEGRSFSLHYSSRRQSARYCCPALCTLHHECLPLLFLTTVLVCVRRDFEHDSIFLYDGSEYREGCEKACRRLRGGLHDYDARISDCLRRGRSIGSQ